MNESLEGLKNSEINELIKNENNTIYQLTTSFNQNNKKYQDISSILLGDCETLLKEKYKLLKNETLIIFKTEQNFEDVIIPLIEFELFNPLTKEILDLKHCRNAGKNITILISKSINKDILFKYDPNHSYYNDICCQMNIENEIDISLYDRNNEFNKNYSLCPKNCIYNRYDSENQKVICNCEIQERISITEVNKDEISYKTINKKRFTNFHILKCYKLVFSAKGLAKNIGNYLILLTIIFYILTEKLQLIIRKKY